MVLNIYHDKDITFFCALVTFTLSFNTLFSHLTYAQLPTTNEKSAAEKEEEPDWPKDSLHRRTPRGAVNGFVEAVAEGNYEQAARYLNLRNLIDGATAGPELAQTLQRLIDQQGNIISRTLISNSYQGRTNDELPPNVDQVGSIDTNGDHLPIYLEQTQDSIGTPIWLFATETLQALPEITETNNILRVNHYLPNFLVSKKWGGVPIGHWLVMLLYVMLAYLVAWALIALWLVILRFSWRQARSERASSIIQALVFPTRIFLAVWIFVFLRQNTGISLVVRQSFSEITFAVGLLAFLMLLWRLIDVFAGLGKEWLTKQGNHGGLSAVLFLRRTVKLILIASGIIFMMNALGLDVTTGLAALGIGGIALALGAQKTIENLVGSLTLVIDQPIRVGDFCKIDGQVGTVEEVGMRSTRIRTLDRTIVFIPNGQLASLKIENYAYRERFLFRPNLALRYETTPDQIRYLLVELRTMLYAHPRVDPDPARVRFIGLGADALTIEIFAYLHAQDFNEFLEVQEDITLRIMDIVADSGTSFAFPSQTIYMAKDSGLSEERTHQAEERVHVWREKYEMQLPKFDEARINDLKGTLDYPPQGSSAQRENGKSA